MQSVMAKNAKRLYFQNTRHFVDNVSSRTMLPAFMIQQNHECIIERFGKYNRVVGAGLHFKLPIIESIAYEYSHKEQVTNINDQMAITKDNVKMKINGVLYVRVVDTVKASYAITNPNNAIYLLAQTTMRSEIGKMNLDNTFRERELINLNIKNSLDPACKKWGLECLRYEIRDLTPPPEISDSMELQAESERRKRSQILESEGKMQAEINKAEGERRSSILKGEGEASKIFQEARSIVESMKTISESLHRPSGIHALKLKIAESYIGAFSNISEKCNSIIVPSSGPESLITKVVAIGSKLLSQSQNHGNNPKEPEIKESINQNQSIKHSIENLEKKIENLSKHEIKAPPNKKTTEKKIENSDSEEN